MDLIFDFAMFELCRVPIFMKFEALLFLVDFWTKMGFLILFNPFFDPQGVKILKNGPHFRIRHVRIVSGTNFREI